MKKAGITLLVLTSILIGCSDFEPFKGEEIRQYVDHVIDFSSQWSNQDNDWSAQELIGENSPNLVSHKNAWSSLSADGQREFLVLGFAEAQTVSKIEIYENVFPGAVDTVYLQNSETQKWITVYSRPAKTDLGQAGRIFSIYLIETPYKANAIRLAINSPAVNSWNEIDAVAITGQK